MENIDKKLQEEVRKLLDEKKVDVVVGYEQGTLPLTATPCFITASADAGKLVWNAFCTQNLAKYVHDLVTQHRDSQKRVKPEDRKKKVVGVIARGCATRSMVIHLQEKQYDRADVVIIGVPCTGYIDKVKLAAKVNGEEILAGSVEGDQLSVKTASGDKKVPLKDVLAGNCLTCRYNNPVISDLLVGEPAPPMDADREYADVEAMEKLSVEERWAYFTKEMAKCMRCYACRQVCPSCYCKVCFQEQSQPRWVGVGEDATDTQVFQLMRIFHMVGRCVDCGSCNDVCPMGVNLRMFLKKLDKDALAMFDYRTGAAMDSPPPLSTYKEHEKSEDFIFNP